MSYLRYDCHTHVGFSLSVYYDDKYPSCFDLISLINHLNRQKIDRAIVFPFPNYFAAGMQTLSDGVNRAIIDTLEAVPYAQQNKRLLQEIRRFGKGRILMFAMFSLYRGIKEQLEILENFMVNHEIYGLKYYADTDHMDLRRFSEEGKPFIEFALRHNLPIVFHISQCSALENRGYSFPQGVITLARQYPNLRVCLAHLAHFNEEILMTARKFKNVFFDTSPLLHLCHIRKANRLSAALQIDYTQPVQALLEVFRMLPDQLMWGTDLPFNFTCNIECDAHDFQFENYSIEKNYEILHSLPISTQKVLESDHVERFLFG